MQFPEKKQEKNDVCMNFFTKLATVTIPLLLLCGGCNGTGTKTAAGPVRVDTTELRAGDLLFRMGLEGASRVVTTVGGGDYSHVGLALRKNGRWMVVHAVPNEAPPGEEDRVKCEPLDSFFAPDRACRGAWRRVRCSDETAARVAQAAYEKYRNRVRFDHDYNLEDTTCLYCTEMVWHLYRKEGIDLAGKRRHQLVVPGKTTDYLFPEDLWVSNRLEPSQKEKLRNP